jgi:putative oxidoreductase
MSVDLGLLALRLFFGTAMAAHGAQKLFGWFGGHGLKGTGSFFDGLGFRPGVVFAAAAGLSEFAGGLSLAAGLLTPLGAAAILGAMLVAIFSVQIKHGFFAMSNGIELPFLYAVAALALALAGPGTLSLDFMFGFRFLHEPALTGALLILTAVATAITLKFRTGGSNVYSTS